MRYIVLLIITLFTSLGLQAQGIEGTKKTTVARIITIDIPKNFRQLTQAEVAQRYPSSRKQIAVYSSPNGTADIGINKGKTVWEEKDIALVRDFYKATLETFYSKTTFEKADIVTVNGKKICPSYFHRRNRWRLKTQVQTIYPYPLLCNRQAVVHFPVQLPKKRSQDLRKGSGSNNGPYQN